MRTVQMVPIVMSSTGVILKKSTQEYQGIGTEGKPLPTYAEVSALVNSPYRPKVLRRTITTDPTTWKGSQQSLILLIPGMSEISPERERSTAKDPTTWKWSQQSLILLVSLIPGISEFSSVWECESRTAKSTAIIFNIIARNFPLIVFDLFDSYV
ncbi:hypothetical protein ABEB36_000369 [Hypothenemus hampei]|uniref:Uncharacterized protein n=1 Tax=Hypothenemus hampei TaxID=57062 RepID=A0ABD1FB29_HYPHA